MVLSSKLRRSDSPRTSLPACWEERRRWYERTIECDATADHVRIAAEPFLPEIPGDKGYIRTFFFLRQKIPAQNRTHAQNIEVVGCQPAAKNLNRVTQPGQSKEKEIFGGQSVENSLAVSKMLIARR